jgi:cation transport regulator ChaC
MPYYFSYGSNMNQENMDRFCKKIGRPLIPLKDRAPRRATLKGFRLDFNYYSTLMKGGAANLEWSPDDQVEGVLFEMSEDDMKTLDEKEKAPSFYHRILVTVTLENGQSIDSVITYVACDDKKTQFAPPTLDYKSDIVEGAKAFGLSSAWIEKLEKLPTQPG